MCGALLYTDGCVAVTTALLGTGESRVATLARSLLTEAWKGVAMTTDRKEAIPKLRESYTTYVYWGFALIFIILLVVGFVVY